MKKICTLFFAIALILALENTIVGQTIKTPEEFFGFKPGTDYKLFNYEKLIDYLKLLEQSSPRVKLAQIGKSPMGKPMYVFCISSADNIKNLDKLNKPSACPES